MVICTSGTGSHIVVRLVTGTIVPCELTVGSMSLWNAQIGTRPSWHPLLFQAPRPSPAIGTIAATPWVSR